MKRLLGLVLCLGSICGWSALAQTGVLAQVDRLETRGQFKQAAEVLKTTLHDLSMPDAERKTLEFELDRLQRIRKDFPYTKAELFAQLKQSVKGLTPAEFEQWASEGRFDSREIDGHLYFMGSSVSNLYFRYPELNARRLGLKDPAPLQKAMWEACVAIRQAAQAEKKPYVLPKRFHVTMTVTAQSNAAPAG